ncbi:HYR domain-containing protein [Mycoplasmatota bacterium WC30]
MKKIRKILLSFIMILTLSATVLVINVKADTVDLIDDTQISGNCFDMVLLANSEYQLIIPAITSTQYQDLDGYMESIEIFAEDGSLLLEYSYDGSPNVNTTLTTGIDVTFTTGASDTTFEMNFYGFSTDMKTVYDGVSLDIQLIWYGNTEPVDEVPPAYTYSQAKIDTPYYNLVTAAQVQAELTATDPEEGDVTSRISIYNDTYTSASKVVGGSYYIMFVVDDTAGNSAYLQVDINVIDDRLPYAEYNSTTYNDGSSLDLSWYDDSSVATQLTLSEIEALFTFDDENYDPGDLTINTTCVGYSENTPGTYTVNIEVIDPSGNEANVTVNVTVLENTSPVITGTSELTIEATDINISNILGLYTGTDTEDGSVSVVVDNTSTWDYNNPALGTFTLVLSSTDSLGKETLKSIIINVVDTTAPVIKVEGIGTSSYSINVNMSDTSTLQTFTDGLTVTDLWDGDLTLSLVVPAVPSFTVPNTTVMNITVSDSSGNEAILALTVNVIDDIPPVINGATKIVKGITATLTLSEITAQVSATDNIDGIISVSVVSDGYTGNNLVLGSYLVQYSATDAAGNITYHDVRVWVVDNQAPAWVLNDFFVNLGVNQSMTRTELVSLLQASGMIGSDISYTVTFVTDDYSGNEQIEGAYSVVLNVVYEDGSEDSIAVELNVPEADSADDVIVVVPDEPMTGLQKALNWIKTAGANIGKFFASIGNGIKTGGIWVYDHLLKPAWEFIFVKDNPDVIPTVTTDTPTDVTTLAVIDLPYVTTETVTLQITDLPPATTSTPYNQV